MNNETQVEPSVKATGEYKEVISVVRRLVTQSEILQLMNPLCKCVQMFNFGILYANVSSVIKMFSFFFLQRAAGNI